MLEGLKILVVEDNLLNHKIVSFILLKQKATIKMAMNGHEAIDILTQDPNYDLVLMDLQMPEMDGYTAIKHIREQLKNDVPIVALTASLAGEIFEESELVGADAFISKPVDPNGLSALIAKLTSEHKNNVKKQQA